MDTPVGHSETERPQTVCVVSENCLASHYLYGLLATGPLFRPVTLAQLVARSRPPREPLAFVVDCHGMDLPLHECLRRVERSYPRARFLILDHPQEKEEIVRMLEIGAHGFLEHEKASQFLLRAVRLVAKGHFWVPPDVLEMFLCSVANGLRRVSSGGEPFTPREQQILELVRKRHSNREIADALRIRVATVKFHLSNILSKCHANGRRELFKDFHWDVWDKLPD